MKETNKVSFNNKHPEVLKMGYNSYLPYGVTRPTYTTLNPRIRQVSSIDEVQTANIDFDGSVFYFLNPVNKQIHTKYFNLDGTTSIYTYQLIEEKNPVEKGENEYITKSEMKQILMELKEGLRESAEPNSKAETAQEFIFT